MTRSTRRIKDVLWTIALAGLVGAVLRMALGLGRTTNLVDAAPWGLWKVLNMVAGVALSTSGFTIGFLAIVLRWEKLKPLVKPAIVVAFLGYGSSCLALMFDIGLPWRFWHPFVMWNVHSFLFEVFWCVILYFTVTTLEVAPTVLDRFGGEKAAKALHKISFGIVVFGISLSSLHHSSLGSLFLVTPERLHGLWYSPRLPLFFIISAMGAGLMFLVLLRILHARYYDPVAVWGSAAGKVFPMPAKGSSTQPADGRDLPMLRTVAGIGATVLGLYLVLKLVDLSLTGGWSLLTAGTWESWIWAVELFLAAGLPVVLVALPSTRRSVFGLGLAGASAAAGLMLNRLDVGIFGYWHDSGVPYVPSLLEWAVGLGVMAAAGLAFMAFVENMPIFQGQPGRKDDTFRPSFDDASRVWKGVLANGPQRAGLIALWVIPLSWMLLHPTYSEQRDALALAGVDLAPAQALDADRTHLSLDGDRRGQSVDFAHAEHQKRMEGAGDCGVCHHVSLPGDRATPCSRCHKDMLLETPLMNHDIHMAAVAVREGLDGPVPANGSCGFCHPEGRPKLAGDTKSCLECHREDMFPDRPPEGTPDLAMATSYQDAMHGVCVGCHQKEAEAAERPGLGECHTCHQGSEAQTRMAAIAP